MCENSCNDDIALVGEISINKQYVIPVPGVQGEPGVIPTPILSDNLFDI